MVYLCKEPVDFFDVVFLFDFHPVSVRVSKFVPAKRKVLTSCLRDRVQGGMLYCK